MASNNSTFSVSTPVGIQQRFVAPPPLQQHQHQQQQQQQEQKSQHRQAIQEQQQQRQLSHMSDVSDACQYLYLHNIHAKVENIFGSLLNDRPEDPLLYILEYMRKKNGEVTVKEEEEQCSDKSTSIILNQNDLLQSSDTKSAGCESDDTASNDICVCEEVIEVSRGEEKLVTDVGEVRRHVVPLFSDASPNDTPVPVEMDVPSKLCSTSNSKLLMSPAEQCVQPIQRCFGHARSAACLVRPTSSLLALRTSVRSSCNDLSHGSTNFRFGGTFSDAQFNTIGGGTSLDREDSTRSDLSMFSLASVDMQDFLQEFRSAKADCVGVETRLVDIEAVSDILQRITIPLPDVTLIAELFDDVKKISDLRYSSSSAVSSEEDEKTKDRQYVITKNVFSSSTSTAEAGTRELVYFDAFLARMAFLIQGRYPTELIRDTFYSILERASHKRRSAAGAVLQFQHKKHSHHHNHVLSQSQQQLRGTDEDGQRAVSSSGSGFSKSTGVSSKNVGVSDSTAWIGSGAGYNATATVPAIAMHTYPGLSLPKSAPCAAHSTSHTAAELSTLLHGVQLSVCVEEGLWRGLGIPVSRADVVLMLRTLGIPDDEKYEFHVNDFVRLVTALTGHSSLPSAADRGSMLLVPPFGRDGAVVPFNESMRGDSP